VHELAIADSVVRIASAHAAGRKVCRVELRVGRLRQVVPSSLEFAFALLTEGTELEGAELAMDVVPAGGRCRTCGFDGPLPELPLRCERCGGFDVDVLRGEELSVDALEIEEDVLMSSGGMGHGD
jgi:hydrogenase nickel incorporation protein HypA/HybF